MPNLVRIGPTVWISIPDTHTHTHTNTHRFNFRYKITNLRKSNLFKIESKIVKTITNVFFSASFMIFIL